MWQVHHDAISLNRAGYHGLPVRLKHRSQEPIEITGGVEAGSRAPLGANRAARERRVSSTVVYPPQAWKPPSVVLATPTITPPSLIP